MIINRVLQSQTIPANATGVEFTTAVVGFDIYSTASVQVSVSGAHAISDLDGNIHYQQSNDGAKWVTISTTAFTDIVADQCDFQYTSCQGGQARIVFEVVTPDTNGAIVLSINYLLRG